MGEALVIVSGKGGVGKSTVAVNLAAALACAGRRVALIDADTGLRSLDVMLGLENNVIYDLTDVAEGVCPLRQALCRTQFLPTLQLLSASQLRDTASVSRQAMAQVVASLRDGRDYVIIDCPAGVDQGFRIAASGADRAIIVTESNPICLRDAERVKGLIQRAGVGKIELLFNRAVHERVKKGEKTTSEEFARRVELDIVGYVPLSDVLMKQSDLGRPAVLVDRATKRVFDEIARRVEGESIPAKPIPAMTFWQWLWKSY